MGLPKIRMPFGGSHNKDYCILGVYIGVHFVLRNYHSLPALGGSGGLSTQINKGENGGYVLGYTDYKYAY